MRVQRAIVEMSQLSAHRTRISGPTYATNVLLRAHKAALG